MNDFDDGPAPPGAAPAPAAAPANAGPEQAAWYHDDGGLRRRGVLRAAVAAATVLATGLPARAAVPALRRGVNLAHWFEYERNQPVSRAEMSGLKAQGFDHVRIPLDPLACGWDTASPALLPFLPALDQALSWAQEAGLTVVLDLHLLPEHKLLLETQSELEPLLEGLWVRLAQAFAARPPEALVYELLNEPQYYGLAGLRWPVLQRRLLAAVRAQDAVHGVLLTGNRGSSIDGLLGLVPEPDAQVAYTFHFYDPFIFTHQGLPWLDERYTSAGTRTGVRYPASLHAGSLPTVLRTNERSAPEWAEYTGRSWDGATVRQAIDRAANWARARGVRLQCTEFGCIRAQVDPASRYRWLADVRSRLRGQWHRLDGVGLHPHLRHHRPILANRPGMAGQRSIERAWPSPALGLSGARPELR